jgi:hypothetical protein
MPTSSRDATQDPHPFDEVDTTLIAWMLTLTPSERLDQLQGFVDSVLELREARREPTLP